MSDFAVVGRIVTLEPHPNADRLDVIWVDTLQPDSNYIVHPLEVLVVGKHYRVGDLGVILRPGSSIPGWLAGSLWLVGKKKASSKEFRFTVKEISIRGVNSQGLWVGQFYQNDTSRESQDHYRELKEQGGLETFREGESWVTPPYWKPDWKVRDVVDEVLDIRPLSLTDEQRLSKPQDAARQSALGSTPAVGSQE